MTTCPCLRPDIVILFSQVAKFFGPANSFSALIFGRVFSCMLCFLSSFTVVVFSLFFTGSVENLYLE